MKKTFLRILSLVIALLSLTLLLASCDLESLLSPNKNNGSIDPIAIKSVRYDGDLIHITYEDGYESTWLIENLALTYVNVFTNASSKNDTATDDPNETDTQSGESSVESADLLPEKETVSDETGKHGLNSNNGSIISVQQGLPTWGVGIIDSPTYVYKNGFLVESEQGSITFLEGNIGSMVNSYAIASFYMAENGKYYQFLNDEISAYVRANLKSVIVSKTLFSSVDPGMSNTNTSSEQEVAVTHIIIGAFAELPALERITLPATIKNIGAGAFHNSPKLTEVIFEGTLEQWETIKKEAGWNHGAAAFTVRCSDGVIEPSAN